MFLFVFWLLIHGGVNVETRKYYNFVCQNSPSRGTTVGLSGDLGDVMVGPTPSSSELVDGDGLLPRVKLLLLLLLLKMPPFPCRNIMCCWAARWLNCFSCEATVEAVFVLNLDMVKSRGCSGSWPWGATRTWCEGGCCSSIGISSCWRWWRFQKPCVKSMVLLFRLFASRLGVGTGFDSTHLRTDSLP